LHFPRFERGAKQEDSRLPVATGEGGRDDARAPAIRIHGYLVCDNCGGPGGRRRPLSQRPFGAANSNSAARYVATWHKTVRETAEQAKRSTGSAACGTDSADGKTVDEADHGSGTTDHETAQTYRCTRPADRKTDGAADAAANGQPLETEPSA